MIHNGILAKQLRFMCDCIFFHLEFLVQDFRAEIVPDVEIVPYVIDFRHVARFIRGLSPCY